MTASFPALALPALAPPTVIRLSDVISALSYALDLTEGQPWGHTARACAIGMRLADLAGIQDAERNDLYYALLLKDAGCSSNAARIRQLFQNGDQEVKKNLRRADWTRMSYASAQCAWEIMAPQLPLRRRLGRYCQLGLQRRARAEELIALRCDRGARIARQMGFSLATAQAIACLDEHWNGQGAPNGLRRHEIPLAAQIINLVQTLEVFAWAESPAKAFAVIGQRSGRWYNPELVLLARGLQAETKFWERLCDREHDASLRQEVLELADGGQWQATEAQLDNICDGFAAIIDAKTHFTFQHSTGVAEAARQIALRLELPWEEQKMLWRAALLHDIGKLAVPNTILEKPGALSPAEWQLMREHPRHTVRILERVEGWQPLARLAGAHHERLDGSGYHLGWSAEQLTRLDRMLAVADVYDALQAERPYRPALPKEKVAAILRQQIPRQLDAECVEALLASI